MTTQRNPLWRNDGDDEQTEAQVIRVIDGDTIVVNINGEVYTVRYLGIDTPETVHPSKAVERGGPEASEANRRLVSGQKVYLEKDVSETDHYGRLLRYVFLTDGTFVNAVLVRSGHAKVNTYPPDVRYQHLFLEMQHKADDERPPSEPEIGMFGPLKGEEHYWRGKYLGGSKLEDIFDILRTGEYAVGGYILRQRQLKEYVDRERAAGRQPKAKEVYKRLAGSLTEGLTYGVKHRISPSTALAVKGFWAGLAADIAYDPTTYTGLGLWKLAKGAKKVIPSVAEKLGVGKTVTGVGDTLGEAFVPGYWIKRLPGTYGEYFDDYLDWVLRKRGAQQTAFHKLRMMAKPYRKSGRDITKYIESRISTGDEILDAYIDDVIRPHTAAMREIEFAHGIDVEEVLKYVPHELTKKGRKYVGWLTGGLPRKSKAYAERRGRAGTIEEINRAVGFEYFETDFWQAMAVRTQKHVHDIYVADWFKHVKEKYGSSLPEHITTHIERAFEAKEVGEVMKMYDTGLTWWKRSVTVGIAGLIHPAFFVRNVYSGVYQNWLRTGMFSPLDYYRGIMARLGKGAFKTLERGKISGKEMQDILREQSILGQPGMTDIIFEPIWHRSLWQKVRDLPSWVMTETENLIRIPEFVKLVRQMSLKEARDITYETHFAYLQEFHTKFEMQYMKRLFPFYTWISRNIPFQVKRTLEQPRKLGGVGKLQQQLIKYYGVEEEYEHRTDWQRNMFLIPNIFKGGRGWIGIGLPFTDLSTDLGDIYFAITPLKLIAELGYMESGWDRQENKRERQLEAIRRTAEGRYGTTIRRLARTWTPTDRLMYLAAMPTYRMGSKYKIQRFDEARWKEPRPTEEEQRVAWIAAGSPVGFKIKSLPGGELLALTKEVYEASQGLDLTAEQLQYILAGSKEARYRVLVDEWNAFKAGAARPEYPTQEQRIKSWRRAGAPEKYLQKIYRDELGKLLGVGTYTPEELEEMGGFTPSETQAEWAFRSTRKMTPIKQFKVWAEEYKTQQEQEHKMQEELTRIAIGAPIKRQKHDPIPLELTMTTRRARRKELEEMLGEGVDR